MVNIVSEIDCLTAERLTMPKLKNLRYETAARAIVLGMGPLHACRAAGFAMRSNKEAQRIIARPEVAERIEELRDHPLPINPVDTTKNAPPGPVGNSITKEYLVREWKTAAEKCRAAGNHREANVALRQLMRLTGFDDRVKPSQPGNSKSKQRSEQEALSDPQSPEGDDADDQPINFNGGAPSVSALDRLLGRLDHVAGDDSEAGLDSADEGEPGADAADGDRGPAEPIEGLGAAERNH